MPVHIRYRMWAIFGGYGVVLVSVILVLGLGIDDALIFGLPLAALGAMFTSVYVDSDTPAAARLKQVRAELVAWRLHRRRTDGPRPATIRSSTWQRRIR